MTEVIEAVVFSANAALWLLGVLALLLDVADRRREARLRKWEREVDV